MLQPPRPRHVAFVGPSGSGKTTLIQAVLAALRERGLRVGYVKQTHHRLDFDTPSKDSWRIREAGADPVLLVTPERYLLQARRGDAGDVDALFAGCDLVIHEGDRRSSYAKVLLGETVERARAGGTEGPIIALVGVPAELGLPAFQRDDSAAVAELLSAYALGQAAADGSHLDALLALASQAAGHLCPGQVLGARMVARGLRELGLPMPPPEKRLLAIVETDGCVAEAVAALTGCSLGRRTLRHVDYGKTAVTFLDRESGRAVRVKARDDARAAARRLGGDAGGEDEHAAQAEAYRHLPERELLTVQEVRLRSEEIPRRPRGRLACSACGEEVNAGREVSLEGTVLCRACAGAAYYEDVQPHPSTTAPISQGTSGA